MCKTLSREMLLFVETRVDHKNVLRVQERVYSHVVCRYKVRVSLLMSGTPDNALLYSHYDPLYPTVNNKFMNETSSYKTRLHQRGRYITRSDWLMIDRETRWLVNSNYFRAWRAHVILFVPDLKKKSLIKGKRICIKVGFDWKYEDNEYNSWP